MVVQGVQVGDVIDDQYASLTSPPEYSTGDFPDGHPSMQLSTPSKSA